MQTEKKHSESLKMSEAKLIMQHADISVCKATPTPVRPESNDKLLIK